MYRTGYFNKKYLNQARVKKTYDYKKIFRYILWIVLLITTIIASYLIYPFVLKYVSNITLFNISKIHVNGNEILSYDDIIKASGIMPNKTSIFTRSSKIIDNLKNNNLINEVTIIKNYPDKIVINIKENKPIAIVNIDELYYINENGKLYEKVDKKHKINLPVITGIKKEDIKDNYIPNYGKSAIEIIKYSSKGVRILGINNISEISYKNDNYLTIYTNDNAIPIYIKLTNLKFDYSRLESVLNHLYRTGLYEKTKKIVINSDKKLYYVSFGEQI